jgi:predicted ester cyclase
VGSTADIQDTEGIGAMSSNQNRLIIRRAFEEANRGNVEASVEMTAPNCLLNGQPFGREGDRARTQAMIAAFPDVRYVLHDLIAEGDKVVARYTMHGAHQGELLGIPPTGKQVAMDVTTIYRLEEGLAVELWEQYDGLGLMRQLGAMPERA